MRLLWCLLAFITMPISNSTIIPQYFNKKQQMLRNFILRKIVNNRQEKSVISVLKKTTKNKYKELLHYYFDLHYKYHTDIEENDKFLIEKIVDLLF